MTAEFRGSETTGSYRKTFFMKTRHEKGGGGGGAVTKLRWKDAGSSYGRQRLGEKNIYTSRPNTDAYYKYYDYFIVVFLVLIAAAAGFGFTYRGGYFGGRGRED